MLAGYDVQIRTREAAPEFEGVSLASVSGGFPSLHEFYLGEAATGTAVAGNLLAVNLRRTPSSVFAVLQFADIFALTQSPEHLEVAIRGGRRRLVAGSAAVIVIYLLVQSVGLGWGSSVEQ